jgi:3-phenylpropionate/trans-cinnamate dioxygenase ferredoxin component
MFNYSTLNNEKLEYVSIGSVSEIKDEGRLFIEIDGKPIVIINLGEKYYAIEDVCSHDDGPVGEGTLEGYEIICPRHGARFDIRTGRVIALPAFIDIPAYAVRIVGDQIEIGLPVDE